jgi:tetratricopeptide (TPR) repeat protein
VRASHHRLIRRIGMIALGAALLLLGCNGPDSRVRGPLRSGDDAVRQRSLREALVHYRAAVNAEPASLQAQTRRAAMAEMLGEFDEALEAYGRAARIEPSALTYYRAGLAAQRLGKTAVAVDYLTASLNAPPTRSERFAQTARRWVERTSASLNGWRFGKYLPDWISQSLGVSRLVLSTSGLDREVVANTLFIALLEGGETTRALDFARSQGWVREGADYCAPGQSWGTVETRALVGMLAAPERADCLLAVGRTLTDGRYVRLARMALLDRSRRSTDPRARRDASVFLRYRLPARDVPKLAESLNLAGYTLQRRFQDQAGAAAAYQRAIAVDPNFSWPYANLGRLYMDMEQHEAALEWLQSAVRVNPDDFRAQVNLGVTLYDLQRYAEAVTAYRAAVALNGDDPLVHADLGRSLLKLGQDVEGVRELQVALRLDPGLTEERELLSRRQAGDPRVGPPPVASRQPTTP